MKYYIKRDLSEFGPYTLADLQRYVAQGNILLTDLTRSEAMTDWVPVSQVIGNIPIPVPAPAMQNAGAPAYTGSAYTGPGSIFGSAPAVAPIIGPTPPDFHWALVLLIGICSCGIFLHAWAIVEAAFARKIKPESKGLMLVSVGIASIFGSAVISGGLSTVDRDLANGIVLLVELAGAVLYLVGMFQIKGDLEEYYNSVEPINLRLSGVMTFFFGVYYFQYHFSRIAQWKKTGVLQPQG
jgi:hypothetical protein